MNNKLKTTAALLTLPGLALAGETMMSEPPVAPTMDYQQPVDGLDWFLGGSAGWLIDAEEGFFSGHLGREFYQSGPWTHSAFLEFGYSDLDNDGNELDLDTNFNFTPGDSFTGDADIEATFIPITLNYKVDYAVTNRLNLYAGAGAGAAYVDVNGDFFEADSGFDDQGDDSEFSFFAQAFAGAGYELTSNFALFGGVRYMFIDDYNIDTHGGSTVEVDENDDILVELGGRFRF